MELQCTKKEKCYLGTQVYNQEIPYYERKDTNHCRHLHHQHHNQDHHYHHLYEIGLYISPPSFREEFVVTFFIVSLIQYLALYRWDAFR